MYPVKRQNDPEHNYGDDIPKMEPSPTSFLKINLSWRHTAVQKNNYPSVTLTRSFFITWVGIPRGCRFRVFRFRFSDSFQTLDSSLQILDQWSSSALPSQKWSALPKSVKAKRGTTQQNSCSIKRISTTKSLWAGRPALLSHCEEAVQHYRITVGLQLPQCPISISRGKWKWYRK